MARLRPGLGYHRGRTGGASLGNRRLTKVNPEHGPGIPTQIQARLATATGHYSARSFDDAAAACRDILAIGPAHTDAHLLLGMALAAKGDLAGGARRMARAVLLQPERVDARHNRALLHLATGNDVDATRGFRLALALEPFFTEALSRLAELEERRRATSAAFLLYRRAHVVAPHSREPLLRL